MSMKDHDNSTVLLPFILFLFHVLQTSMIFDNLLMLDTHFVSIMLSYSIISIPLYRSCIVSYRLQN